ncbi:MAG: hypothetical protein ACI3ZW_12470 [Parabacteroides sp.]
MKKLKILSLKDDVKELTSMEMKMLRGGSAWCHCLDDQGDGHFATDCAQCFNICSGKGGVQNCSYIV